MKTTDEVHHFIGIEIIKGSGGIYLGQEAYALKVVEQYVPIGMEPRDSLNGISLEDAATLKSPLLNEDPQGDVGQCSCIREGDDHAGIIL
jgi:hypothetical protein